MFDISSRLVSEQEEISGLKTLDWENHSWKYLSLIGDERVINLQRTKVYVFSDSVLCLGKILEPPIERCMGTKIGMVQIISCLEKLWQNRRWANGIRRINTLQLNEEVKSLLLGLDETPENFTRRIKSMCCSTTSLVDQKTMKKECLANAKLVTLYARRFGKGQRSFIGPGSAKKWYSISEDGQYGRKDVVGIRWERMSNLPCYKPIVLRSTQKQKTWKIVDTLCSRYGNDWNCFSNNCFCKPAQPSRSSRRNGWRIRNSSRSNWATRCERTIEFLIRAKQGSSIAAIWRMNWKTITTRQIEQILYGRKISECCWEGTILHDERHCRIFTISCRGLSWVHLPKGRRLICTKKLVSREHQIWARIGSYNQLFAR